MLQNQALAIDAFLHGWPLAGQDAQSFVQRTGKNSEDLFKVNLLQQSASSQPCRNKTTLHYILECMRCKISVGIMSLEKSSTVR